VLLVHGRIVEGRGLAARTRWRVDRGEGRRKVWVMVVLMADGHAKRGRATNQWQGRLGIAGTWVGPAAHVACV
jgi:hypothetical protein